jgi:hypothetical protein
MPPPGQCRVWYEGVPPGRQPRPTNCDDAERAASRSRDARVIYGSDRDRGAWSGRDDRGGVSRRDPRYPRSGSYGYGTIAFDNGYRDGVEKGDEDARDRDSYDPVRHSRYRSADRGYESRYGSKDAYKNVYRDGFRAGYDDGYRGGRSARRDSGGWWPF